LTRRPLESKSNVQGPKSRGLHRRARMCLGGGPRGCGTGRRDRDGTRCFIEKNSANWVARPAYCAGRTHPLCPGSKGPGLHRRAFLDGPRGDGTGHWDRDGTSCFIEKIQGNRPSPRPSPARLSSPKFSGLGKGEELGRDTATGRDWDGTRCFIEESPEVRSGPVTFL
jgi:hypothetical protein